MKWSELILVRVPSACMHALDGWMDGWMDGVQLPPIDTSCSLKIAAALASPLFLAVGSVLQVPLSIVADLMLHGAALSLLQVGAQAAAALCDLCVLTARSSCLAIVLSLIDFLSLAIAQH